MSDIAFTARLTSDDWDEAMHGWRCQVLNVPGAIVEAIYVDGNRVDTARYEVLTEHTFIRWIASDQPQRAAASIRLTETLSLGAETERWRRLAIVLPVVATILAAAISGAATYFSRISDAHAPFTSTPSSDSHRSDARTPVPTPDGSATDVIDAVNTNFSSALAIELGQTYLARFRDDDSSLYFGFHQLEGAHDLNVELTLVGSEADFLSVISIYGTSREKLFSRWHEKSDGNSIRWTAPVTPGYYVVEIKPNGVSSNFARFLIRLTSG